jgi:hypothetical protein
MLITAVFHGNTNDNSPLLIEKFHSISDCIEGKPRKGRIRKKNLEGKPRKGRIRKKI